MKIIDQKLEAALFDNLKKAKTANEKTAVKKKLWQIHSPIIEAFIKRKMAKDRTMGGLVTRQDNEGDLLSECYLVWANKVSLFDASKASFNTYITYQLGAAWSKIYKAVLRQAKRTESIHEEITEDKVNKTQATDYADETEYYPEPNDLIIEAIRIQLSKHGGHMLTVDPTWISFKRIFKLKFSENPTVFDYWRVRQEIINIGNSGRKYRCPPEATNKKSSTSINLPYVFQRWRCWHDLVQNSTKS